MGDGKNNFRSPWDSWRINIEILLCVNIIRVCAGDIKEKRLTSEFRI